jgi:hypothetical protein
MAKRAPKAQITDYDREYLSKLLEQSLPLMNLNLLKVL